MDNSLDLFRSHQHSIASQIGLVPNVKNQANRRICLKSYLADNMQQHAYFWQGYIFSLDLLDDLNKYEFSVTSHFTA